MASTVETGGCVRQTRRDMTAITRTTAAQVRSRTASPGRRRTYDARPAGTYLHPDDWALTAPLAQLRLSATSGGEGPLVGPSPLTTLFLFWSTSVRKQLERTGQRASSCAGHADRHRSHSRRRLDLQQHEPELRPTTASAPTAPLYAADSAIQGAIEYIRDNPEMSSDVLDPGCLPAFYRYTDPKVGDAVTVDACPQDDSLIYDGHSAPSFSRSVRPMTTASSSAQRQRGRRRPRLVQLPPRPQQPDAHGTNGGRVWAWGSCNRPATSRCPGRHADLQRQHEPAIPVASSPRSLLRSRRACTTGHVVSRRPLASGSKPRPRCRTR